MPNDVATTDGGQGGAIVPVRPSDNLLAQVIAAAKDPSIDAEKMKTLADLVNGQQDRERLIEFNRDLNAAIMEMPVITKDGLITIKEKGTNRVIQSTKFAKFEDIDRVVRPILKRHNLAMRFEVDESGGQTSVRPILSHANGHTERGGAMRAPIDSSGSKNNVQGTGSTVSYLKRYTMCATLNIITEGVDDDANGGAGQVISMANEREQLVLAEATAAHEAGRYEAYFASLGPKDRAWLLSSGKHAGFGGQMLIGKAPTGPSADSRREAEPEREPEPEPEKPKARMSARQWVEQFKGDLGQCATTEAAAEFMDEARGSLDKLKGSNEALWNEAQDAYRDRCAAIEEGRLV